MFALLRISQALRLLWSPHFPAKKLGAQTRLYKKYQQTELRMAHKMATVDAFLGIDLPYDAAQQLQR